MTKDTIDRRISRTRAMLQHALNSLILNRGYEAITIKDICEEANVGRSTFYAHYTSKDDLKRSAFEHLRRQLLGRQRDAQATPGNVDGAGLAFSLTMFEHARDHVDHYRTLVGGRGGAVSLDAIREILSELVRNDLIATANKNTDGIPREFVVQYVVGAYMSVMTWWLDGGANLPPQQVDAMFRSLAIEGIKASHS